MAETNIAFVCVGLQKAGTDWVYDQFCNHSEFGMPPIKELHFFNRGFGRARKKMAERKIGWMSKRAVHDPSLIGPLKFCEKIRDAPARIAKDFRFYIDLLSELTELRTADICPGYIHLSEEKLTRIRNRIGARIFAIVRDPVDRAWSQALMHARIDADLHQTHSDATTSADAFGRFLSHPSVAKLSQFSEALDRYDRVFGERFKVFVFDGLAADPVALRREIAKHVDCDPNGFTIAADHNRKAKQPGKFPMPAEIRRVGLRMLAEEYEKLERRFPETVALWRMRHARALG